jgi:hypothetical protein
MRAGQPDRPGRVAGLDRVDKLLVIAYGGA